METYHRHQVPGPDFPVWNQFRKADGKPLYPQRPMLAGQDVQSGGATMSGRFNGKMIVMQALMNEAAYPCGADWYRTRVKAALGSEVDDRYRLWFVDNSLHTPQGISPNDPRPVATTRVIDYQGVLQQALRDLSAWVEKRVAPPASTNYTVADGQVLLPPTAAARKGVQPTVDMKANGGARADVKVGDTVEFTATIDAPPSAGPVVKAEWDCEGAGAYPVFSPLAPSTSATVSATYAFTTPGTYFPALRATVQRDGDAERTAYARVQNLGRVRVVVT